MKTKSIPNLKFKDLGNDAFSVSTPTEHISLNSVILLVAKKQSGKTFFASNLMNQLKQVKACDRIFVISDTFNSNKKMMEHLNIDRGDIFSPNTKFFTIFPLNTHKRIQYMLLRRRLFGLNPLKQQQWTHYYYYCHSKHSYCSLSFPLSEQKLGKFNNRMQTN